MHRFSKLVTTHNKPILIIFIVIAIISAFAMTFVGVNYRMTEYLPPDAQSTKALDIMSEEFGGSMPNTSVMVKDVSIQEAISYKEQLKAVENVTEVLWLDDMVDIREPLETADTATVEGFYKNGNALFTVTIAEDHEQQASDDIRALIGEKGAISGEAPDLATMQQATGNEVGTAMAILLPIIVIILVLSTSSWIEPLLFFATIGVAIVINMGTNIFFGEVSFMTNSVSPILQLAVSLDYAIFMLHSFAANRQKYGDVKVAMQHAIRESMSTVAASAATTLFGFLALAFMNFQIGADLGINLAKGIVISFVTSMIFLPALTLATYKIVDKTKHRRLLPSFKNVNRVFSKLAIPAIIVVAILIVPSFLGQSQTEFLYGNGSVDTGGESSENRKEIQEEFGQSTITVLLVPRGDVAKEWQLGKDLEALPHVTSVMSYANTVGTAIPPEFLGEDVTGQFYSDNYARIIAYTDTPAEGDLAFATVEEIMAEGREYYGDEAYSLGESANLYDMKMVVKVDNQRVTLVAVIAIFAVLLFTFKSATLPLILLLTIETGIWINLAIPYFTGTPINFIGYLVLNTVQLGATVDYAILLTTTYTRHRKRMPQKEAMYTAMGECFESILVSAATLATAGFTLYITSTNPAVSDIGLLLGRGTLLSLVMVVCFLPALLRVFDKAIAKTTYKSGFLMKPHRGKTGDVH